MCCEILPVEMRTSARQRQKVYSNNSSRTACRLCSTPLSSTSSYEHLSHNDNTSGLLKQYNNNQNLARYKVNKDPVENASLRPVVLPKGRTQTSERPAASRPSLPYGLDCSGEGDCPCSARRRYAHCAVKLASPASTHPTPTTTASRAPDRVLRKTKVETNDLGIKIPYPASTIRRHPPESHGKRKQEHLGPGGDAHDMQRTPVLPPTSRRLPILLACTVLLALMGLFLVHHASREAVVAPPSRQLCGPLTNGDARVALSAAPAAALQQLHAELRQMRRELRRVKERTMEDAWSSFCERRLARAGGGGGDGDGDVPMADFALETAGGAVVATPGTSAYTTGAWETLWGLPLWPVEKSPRNIIQPSLEPGACWAFRGAEGRVVVALALPARLSAVTLEHIPASAALTGRRDSAPRDFVVKGLEKPEDTSGHLLGQFSYSLEGAPHQTFLFQEQPNMLFKAVLLHILNNHGNSEYTCVYRFRVHGNAITKQTVVNQSLT